ncbi:MAG: hypothetical protein R2838_10715 [Caldilineaceae bacterium]
MLEAAAGRVPPGSQGLMLVPYWNNVMNPYWDPAAPGITIGWTGPTAASTSTAPCSRASPTSSGWWATP